MNNPSITTLPVWKALEQHIRHHSGIRLEERFAEDPSRAARFSQELGPLFVDYSKQPVSDETLTLLAELAEKVNLSDQIEAMFSGENINHSENRPALHTALRSTRDSGIRLNDQSVHDLVLEELRRMELFVTRLHNSDLKGFSDDTIDTVVNIGIGGSDLGPRLANHALWLYANPDIHVHFVANIDKREIDQVLNQINPRKTLFIIASKSFTSLETVTNAETARQWLIKHGATNPYPQMFAVSANAGAASEYGIPDENIFSIWDWVGGRYSIWSAIGLPVASAIGMENFRTFLAGAEQMDRHFRESPFDRNIPVLLALIDILHINFLHAEALAVIPYDQSLALLPDYLSQLCMESNGKRVKKDGNVADVMTGAIIWGGTGTNCQHAFMQLLHQGTHHIPVEFLVACNNKEKDRDYQSLLYASCIAQGEALMRGNQTDTKLPPEKIIPGNKPSTTIVYQKLSPDTLGMLIALYEHRTFVQAAIWGINPFDQWGVELGKTITRNIKKAIDAENSDQEFDSSTRQLISRFHGRE